tara:strand:- start:1566 stop:1805 length:240 start_codon:yes stop_codon:yes gene_type:complete
MPLHPSLIHWSLLTHAYDSLKHLDDNKPTMTYAELLTLIQQMPVEKLNNKVVIYDQDCDDLMPVDDEIYDNERGTYLQI